MGPQRLESQFAEAVDPVCVAALPNAQTLLARNCEALRAIATKRVAEEVIEVAS
jgi:hypothetical protein